MGSLPEKKKTFHVKKNKKQNFRARIQFAIDYIGNGQAFWNNVLWI